MLSSKKLSYASRKAMDYLSEVYRKNRKLLEEGFTPETNNMMEQLFSFINDFAFMCGSFKIEDGLKNWASNLFLLMNHRPFNTEERYFSNPNLRRMWIIFAEDFLTDGSSRGSMA
jgi:hypothetical protein